MWPFKKKEDAQDKVRIYRDTEAYHLRTIEATASLSLSEPSYFFDSIYVPVNKEGFIFGFARFNEVGDNWGRLKFWENASFIDSAKRMVCTGGENPNEKLISKVMLTKDQVKGLYLPDLDDAEIKLKKPFDGKTKTLVDILINSKELLVPKASWVLSK